MCGIDCMTINNININTSMEKTVLKSIAAVAISLLALGCNKEQVAVDGTPDGQEVTVAFTAGLPGTPATKAIGDGTTAKNLTVAVYEDYNNAAGNHLNLDQTATFTDLKTTVNFSLVKGKTYHFIFWAQATGAPYTFDKDAKEIKISYAGTANDESRDAFFAVKTVKVTGAMSEPVELHRPFAQVNFGTADYNEAVDAGIVPAKSVVEASDVATSFLPFEGKGVNAGTDTKTSFTLASFPTDPATITVEGEDYKYLAMNYFIPAGEIATKHVTNLTAKFYDEQGNQVGEDVNVPSAPVQANWRTNIVGNLFTDQVVFNVEIKPAFEDDNNIDLRNISTTAALKALFANGGSAKLTANIELESGLILAAGKDAAIDLNGFDIINKSTDAAIKVAGSLEINGDGNVDGGHGGDNVAVWALAGGKVRLNGGHYNVGADANGKANTCIYSTGGDIVINGGYYRTELAWNGRYYVLNLQNGHPGSIKVYGGQFENYDPKTGDDVLGGSFLAPGYKSVNVNGSYYVAKDDAPVTIGVSGQDELDSVISGIPAGETAEITLVGGGTYKLPELSEGMTIGGQTGNEVIDCAATTTVSAKDVAISNVIVKGNGANTNGSSLAMNGGNSSVTGCTFQNGRQYTYGSDLSVSNKAGSIATVSDCDFRKSGFRGVMIWDTGDDVKIDNCLFDNTYPFNCDAGTGKITVTDSELKGWTSYTNTLELVSFTNCKFGKSTSGYAYLVPYSKTVVKDCTFSADFLVSPSGAAAFTVEFINCKYEDGTAITSSIMDSDADNHNAICIIDGVTYNY